MVWDIATRLFHWLLVSFVLVCSLTGDDEGLQFAIHAYAGFVVVGLLLFRAGWGIVGCRHSRFTDFAYSWPTVRGYAIGLLRLKPDHYVGHNPLGGWMILLMLLTLTAASVTGLIMVTKGAGWLENIHEAAGSMMQILVLAHIAGVLVDRLLTGDKIVKDMISGYKELAVEAGDVAPRVAGAGRMAAASFLKLAAMPFFVFVILQGLGVGNPHLLIAVLFAGSSVAPSSYVLARQLGGDATLMAGIVTATTLAAMASLPVLISLVGR